MKKLITLLIAILSVAGIYADDYREYLEASRKHLAEGNKEKAESCYRVYKKMTGKKDAELEKTFFGSAQSGDVGSTTINYPNGDRYVGEEKYGKRHGKGTMFYADNRLYIGEWYNDIQHGYGVLTQKNGDQYEGYFVNDKYNGKGTYYNHNGDHYVGEWKDDVIHGLCTVYRKDGTHSTAMWENGKITVQLPEEILADTDVEIHTINYNSGDKYVGEYKDGKRHGYGTYCFSSGAKYIGHWKNGLQDGFGVYYNTKIKVYEGGYKEGKYCGHGIKYDLYGVAISGMWENDKCIEVLFNLKYKSYNNGRYIGELKDGKRHGRGSYYWADGNRYEGEWKDDKPNGQGTMYYKDGSLKSGSWEMGVFVGE